MAFFRHRRHIVYLVLLLIIVVPVYRKSVAQVLAPGYDADDPADVFLPCDRRLRAILDQAERELDKPDGDHREALSTIQRVIEDGEDVFSDTTMTDSVRQQAQRRLGQLEGDLRRLYEEMFNPSAIAILETSEQDRTQAQRDVVRRFFQTSTGADASYMLATAQMDRGEVISAARLFDRMRREHRRARSFEPDLSQRCITCYWRGGNVQQAARVLLETLQTQPGLELAGDQVTELSSQSDAINWLTSRLDPPLFIQDVDALGWTTPHGTSSRDMNVAPVSTLFDDAWQVPLIRDWDADDAGVIEELQTLLEAVVSRQQDAGGIALPVLRPIVVGDLLVFPSYGLLKAVNRHNGELAWVALPADESFAENLTATTGVGRQRVSQQMEEFLIQRAWLDATSSQVSSDKEQVYVVRDSGTVGGGTVRSVPIARWPQGAGVPVSNSLRAYDARGGNWKWEIGGTRKRAALPLAGTFFLGPPLAVEETLYVLGEDLGQVRLLALDPRNGELKWSVPLANSDADLEDDLDRRLGGLSPTASGGLLVCPTGTGMVVAVDPVTRSLEWGLNYREPQSVPSSRMLRRGPFIGMSPSQSEQMSLDDLLQRPRWHDCCALAAGGALLIAPSDVAVLDDDQRLLCVEPLDGTVRWTRPRGDGLYIGTVYDGVVLIVGAREVVGVELDSENGETLWTLPLATPSGRGVRSGAIYHLPLQGGEIATIDIRSGRLLARSPSRSGRSLGNLIAVDGQLYSQSPTEVRAFRPRRATLNQIAEDLKEDPHDPAALAARGELRLHSGDTQDGLRDLRQVVETTGDPRSHQLLVSTLLEGMRADFAEYRGFADELDRLATTSDIRIRFLMTYAEGLLDADEPALAYRQLLQAVKQHDLAPPLQQTSDGRIVRRDRLLQGRIAELYATSSREEKAQWDTYLQDVLANNDDGDTRALKAKLAAAIPSLRATNDDSPAEIQSASGERATRLESRLLTARRDSPKERQGIIAAQLVELYARKGCTEPVAHLLNELETAWAESPSLDGLTGAEWAARARESAEVLATLKSEVNWPTEEILVREGVGRSSRFAALRREGPDNPVATKFLFLPDSRQISIRDGYGRPWRDGVLPVSPGTITGSASQYVMQRGHRALINLGTQFQLVDLLDGVPRVILAKSLTAGAPPDVNGFAITRRGALRQPGFRGTFMLSERFGDYGSVGPLNDHALCYQAERSLHAHDPFTGELYWTVADTPENSEIFADEDFVLLVPVMQNTAHLYRALDGQKLGVRKLPPDVVRERHGADWGRLFLRVMRTEDGMRLAMFDPVIEQNLWERPVSADFHWSPRDGSEICVVDQTGKLVVLDPATGAVLFETDVDVPGEMESFNVLSLAGQWIVTTYRRSRAEDETQLAPRQFVESAFPVNGPTTAFERGTDGLMWSRVISHQVATPQTPARWPILPLAAVRESAAQTNRGRFIPVLTRQIELINLRTGETEHVAETDGSGQRLDLFWQVSAQEPQLRLQLGLLELDVSFRSRPGDEDVDEKDAGSAGDSEDAATVDPTTPQNELRAPKSAADDDSP